LHCEASLEKPSAQQLLLLWPVEKDAFVGWSIGALEQQDESFEDSHLQLGSSVPLQVDFAAFNVEVFDEQVLFKLPSQHDLSFEQPALAPPCALSTMKPSTSIFSVLPTPLLPQQLLLGLL